MQPTQDSITKAPSISSATDFKSPTASLAGRNVGDKSTSTEISDLRNQIKKLSDVVAQVIPYLQNRISDLESKNVELEKELSTLNNTVNSHFSQIIAQNSSILTTITTVLDGTQREFQRLSEQVKENGKAQKELQEQSKAIMQVTLKQAIKDGLLKMDDDELSLK